MCTKYMTPEQRAVERAWLIRRGSRPWWQGLMRPRMEGPFVRLDRHGDLEAVIGTWGLVPWFSKTPKVDYATFNARSEEVTAKASYKQPWARGQRCLIPAESFDEPNWESLRNVWWRFKRKDGDAWALAGLWNTWVDRNTGEVVESYSMLTVNCDAHPLLRRMHKPDPSLPQDRQDKRSVVSIERADFDRWLRGSIEEARTLLVPPALALIDGTPAAPDPPPASQATATGTSGGTLL